MRQETMEKLQRGKDMLKEIERNQSHEAEEAAHVLDCMTGDCGEVGIASIKKISRAEAAERDQIEIEMKTIAAPISEPFDCEAGEKNWQRGWSVEKKDWCCKNKQTGCETSASHQDEVTHKEAPQGMFGILGKIFSSGAPPSEEKTPRQPQSPSPAPADEANKACDSFAGEWKLPWDDSHIHITQQDDCTGTLTMDKGEPENAQMLGNKITTPSLSGELKNKAIEWRPTEAKVESTTAETSAAQSRPPEESTTAQPTTAEPTTSEQAVEEVCEDIRYSWKSVRPTGKVCLPRSASIYKLLEKVCQEQLGTYRVDTTSCSTEGYVRCKGHDSQHGLWYTIHHEEASSTTIADELQDPSRAHFVCENVVRI